MAIRKSWFVAAALVLSFIVWVATGPVALWQLKQSLRDPEPSKRSQALQALSDRGWEPTSPRDLVSHSFASGSFDRLPNHRDEVRPHLASATGHTSLPDIQTHASRALVFLGDSASLQILVDGIERRTRTNRPDRTQREMMFALVEGGDLRGVRPLVSFLLRTTHGDRERAADMLRRLGGTAVAQILLDSAKSALGRLAPPPDSLYWMPIREDGQIDLLVEAMETNTTTPGAAYSAAWSLQYVRSTETLAPLLRAYEQHPLLGVRRVAALALGRVHGRAVLARFIADVRRPGPSGDDRRRHAAEALGIIGAPESRGPLVQALQRPGPTGEAAQALGSLDDPSVVPDLLAHLADWAAGQKVAMALDKFGWVPTDLPDSVHYWVAKREFNQVLGSWEAAHAVFLEDLDSREPYRARNAMMAFIRLGLEVTVPTLVDGIELYGTLDLANAYLNSGHDSLRSAAIKWGRANGYQVVARPGSADSWGSM